MGSTIKDAIPTIYAASELALGLKTIQSHAVYNQFKKGCSAKIIDIKYYAGGPGYDILLTHSTFNNLTY